MSQIQERINADIISTMKLRDMANDVKLSGLKMGKNALQMKEKDKRSELTEAEAEAVLLSVVKKHKESIEMFEKGSRVTEALIEKCQMDVVLSYLPKEAEEKTIIEAIEKAIVFHLVGVENPNAKHMGVLIPIVKNDIAKQGLRADGKKVSELIKERLTTIGK